MTPAGLSKCFEGIAASRFTDDMMLMPEREKQERPYHARISVKTHKTLFSPVYFYLVFGIIISL